MNKTFSFIIPVYNGAGVVEHALDSIYSQGLSLEDFEVICVDDCSPTLDTYNALNNYVYHDVHPNNLHIIRHTVNKRQGGARNTALLHAKGEWILYLDQDDYFLEHSLLALLDEIKSYHFCSILMFDYVLKVIGRLERETRKIYTNTFKTEVLSGFEFIKRFPIPWTPWCYAYKRDFLLRHKILFEENVRFEDVDYVIKSTLLADRIVFVPLETYCHIDSGENTSVVGNDKARIEDLFKISVRIKNVSLNFMTIDKSAASAAMGHHVFHYHSLLVSYLWRLSYDEIVGILIKYPPYKNSNDQLIIFASKFPRIYAITAQIVRPVLLSLLWVRKRMRR